MSPGDPSVEHLLDILARAAVGDREARVEAAPGGDERLAHAVNILLSDLAGQAGRDALLERAAAGEARAQLLALLGRQLQVPRSALAGLEAGHPPSEALHRGLAQLAETIAQLEELVGLEAATVAPVEEPLDVRALLDERIAVAAPQLAAAVDLTLAVDAGVPEELRGDPGRIAEVVDALLAAATATTAAGTVAVRAGAERGGAWWVLAITVTDTGTGIPPEVLARVTDPYGGPPLGTLGLEHVLGLRLAVARRTAEATGGRLELTSTVGKGTTAVAVLPLAGSEGAGASLTG